MKQHIRRFLEINEFFETTGFEKRTDIADFFVFRFDELPKDNALKMPPYQKDFYQVSLIMISGNAVADINEQSNKTLENTLYFLSPEHIFSWQRNIQTTGFVVYFKTAFLNFFSGNFKNEFSFFNLSEQNFLKLENEQAAELASDFEKIHKEYYTPNPYRVQILQSFLLSLLFKYKSLQEVIGRTNNKPSKKQELVFQFQNLVTNCYIKHKQVGEYAKELNISANTLNQTVKEILGKTAKELISEKIIQESKKRLKYSTDDVSEIAYSIGFEEPTHFIRFFKKQTATTPKEYRNSQM
ncbi:helix-turn-helix domain-containing protein [Lacihabitans lacunae]|uniref:Helix-turn-helix domain-containing protein n=1 Tax=Lacihabitans lacunae TaxID=1028214 RepID=A0ABV7YUS9_9BACT